MTGIPAEAFEFYDHLAIDNSREFWTAHKDEYEQFVRGPLLTLAATIEPDFGPSHLYRPYRDMRFATDKVPYKDHQGCVFAGPNGLGWYVQVSSTGLMLAGGWYQSTAEQVKHYRQYLAEYGGQELRKAMATATKGGFVIDGDQLKTRPRGVAAEDPDLDLFRYRTMHATQHMAPEAWMETARLERTVRSAFEEIRPLIEVLSEMAGPAQ